MAAKKQVGGGTEAAALVVEHWRWADRVARRLARKVSTLEPDEVSGDVLLALVEAARRFKRSKGVTFQSFARHRIEGAVRDHKRRRDMLGRWERLHAKAGKATKWSRLGVTPHRVKDSVHDIAADQSDHRNRFLATRATQEDDVFSVEVRAKLEAALRQLPERQRDVLERVHFRGQTLKTVGVELGVTESRACQIAGAAYAQLRELLEDPRGAD